MQIIDGQTASDIYAGTASKSWLETIGDFVGSVAAKIGDVIGDIKIGEVRLGDWYATDPVGATAAVTLGGVVMFLGGKAVVGGVRAVSSLISAVRSLGVLGTLRAGATAVARNIGQRAMYLLGHPRALATRALMGITIGAVMKWVAGGVTRLINFNWNESDQELDAKVKSAQDSLWGISGGALGTLIGTALCGVVPGASIVRVNPAKLAAIREVNQELYEETLPAVKSLINATIRVGATKTLTSLYKNARKALKSLSPIFKNIPFVGGTIAEWLKKWGAPDAKPWSINSGIETVIQSIGNEGIKRFFEELWENFLESCTETVFVLSTAF
jgi:hypothetical protein